MHTYIFTTDGQKILQKLLHVVSFTLVSKRQDDPANLIHVELIIMIHMIPQSLIQISSKSCLIVCGPGTIALINGSPSITDQLLKKSTMLEEILWFCLRWTYMKPIGIPEKLSDFLGVLWISMCILQGNVQMPAFFSMWKKQNIVKWKIGWVKIADTT